MKVLPLLLLLAATSLPADEITMPSENKGAVGQGASQEKSEPVIMARVGDVDLTVEVFMKFISQNSARVNEVMTDEGKVRLLRQLIGNMLIGMSLKDQGLITDNPTAQQKQEALKALSQKHFPLLPLPSEEAMRHYYMERQNDFAIPASVRVTQIQILVPKGANQETRAQAKARAEAALARVRGGEDFANVAADVTENPRARETLGDLGYVAIDGYDWLQNALKDVQVGAYTSVLESPQGYEILMLTDQREAVITPFDRARNRIAQRMRLEEQQKARESYIRALAEQKGVQIVMDELKPLFPNGVFPAE